MMKPTRRIVVLSHRHLLKLDLAGRGAGKGSGGCSSVCAPVINEFFSPTTDPPAPETPTPHLSPRSPFRKACS